MVASISDDFLTITVYDERIGHVIYPVVAKQGINGIYYAIMYDADTKCGGINKRDNGVVTGRIHHAQFEFVFTSANKNNIKLLQMNKGSSKRRYKLSKTRK